MIYNSNNNNNDNNKSSIKTNNHNNNNNNNNDNSFQNIFMIYTNIRLNKFVDKVYHFLQKHT